MNDSQRQRWIKYGGNVLLSSVVVIALAVLVIYAAERKPKRIDTTAEGLYSLKPQTLKIIGDLKTPIKIVSLYTQSKPPPSPDQADQASAPIVPQDQAAQMVNDLLEEYASGGKNITLETIDPVTSPTKVDDLIEQVETKYGGEVQKYKTFVDSFKTTISQVSHLADNEVTAIKQLPKIENPNPDLEETINEMVLTIYQFPKSLADLQDALQRPLKQKPPDYKGAADAITEGMSGLSNVLGAVINNFGVLQKRGGLPPAIEQYMKDSLPRYQAMKKIADDSLAADKLLGELKLDTLRSALRERNTILVMGDKEWRAITFDQVWQPAGRTAMAALSDTPPKPRFAGEQQVTAAILALSSGGRKPKVAFVRAGGSPLTQSMSFMGGEPPMSEAGTRLGLYNFDVVEKDLTGQYAAQSQGMAPPEPSDDDIKNATWVVWAFKAQQQSQFGGESPSIAPQVAEHLKQGGSAVIITGGGLGDPMTEALSDWGVDVNTAQFIVHEKIASAGGSSSDMLDEALRMPLFFDFHEYGDHPLTNPLSSLEGIFIGMCPVKIRPVAGYKATPILPVPTTPSAPHSWASATYTPRDPSAPATFDPAADTDGPLYAGAAVEKLGAGRVVVLGAGDFAVNQLLDFTGQEINPDAPPVLKFPANGELFTNSVFWAARQDTLIDISPAAMDVGRIHDMSGAALRFWRIGVLLIGLPGLVLLTGAGVYLQRRD